MDGDYITHGTLTPEEILPTVHLLQKMFLFFYFYLSIYNVFVKQPIYYFNVRLYSIKVSLSFSITLLQENKIQLKSYLRGGLMTLVTNGCQGPY